MNRAERAHERVRDYAHALALPREIAHAVEITTPTLLNESVWCVDTRLWWERRSFVFRGALENEIDHDSYVFDGLKVAITALPDRWDIPHDRPQPFTSGTFGVAIPRKGALQFATDTAMSIEFGTKEVAWTFGDPAFPMSLRGRLAVQARFEGVDSVPTMQQRRGSPYREAELPSDRGDMPVNVMDAIRDFVREIDLPGYNVRIHGWRTLVQGGPLAHLRYALGPVRDRDVTFDAIVLDDGLVYAPDLSDFARS